MICDHLLFKEMDCNVAPLVAGIDPLDCYEVSGHSHLHLTVHIIETMRREGFEVEVGPPTVIFKKNEGMGNTEKLWESGEIRVPEEYVGGVVDLLNMCKGEL
jgi:GTP-binding protein